MTEAPAALSASPYRGLAAFDESDLDALFFFGRERETAVIAANVMAARFTVLYGPMGVGKSSVLHAGVARRLRSLAPDATVVVYDSWAGDPAAGLLGSVASALGVEPPPGVNLADGLAGLVVESGADLFLLLDQFEEVFVYSGAETLAESLAEIVMRPDLPVNVLVALREDAFAELDVFTGRIRNVFGNYLALDRLDRTAARAAVTGPIARFNELSEARQVEVEEELVEAVLDQVTVGQVVVGGRNGGPAEKPSKDAVEAPYLQLVMEKIWDAETRHGSTVLRRETLDELGGAQAIVHAHLGEAVQALAPDEQDVAARVFNHLVTPSGTKIAHGAEDLAEYAGVDEEDLRPVLTSLGANRIVRPADGRFEIYHDVLADAVLSWRARHEAERALERERAEAERRHRRLLVFLVSSLLVLAVVAGVAVYALTQRSEARDQATVARSEALSAHANRLAAEASVLIPVAQAELNPELALALAAEATRLAPTERAVNTLRRALLLSNLRAVVPEDDVSSASFSPDGARIVVGTEDGTVAVYANDARTLLTTIRLGNPATSVSFGPDGRRILTTERGGPARIWDSATGGGLQSLGEAPTAASFDPDGSLVLTVEPRGVRVWRAEDGSLVTQLRQPGAVRDASFGAGHLVATVGAGSIVRVFDARTGERLAAVDHGDVVTSATITRGGKTLVTTGRDGIARVWSLRRGGRLVRQLEGHSGPITDGVAASDGTLFVTTSTDGTARVWDLPSGRSLAEFAGHAGRVEGAAFSRDSHSVVTWGAGGTARVGSPRSVTAQALLAGHGDAVTSASFDPSGDLVLTTSADGQARLWRSGFEARLLPLARAPTPVSAAEFSSDGSAAAMAGPSAIEILRTADGESLGQVAAPAASVIALSGDGSLVAYALGARISVRHAGTDDPAAVVEADAEPTALALSQTQLAAGAADGSIAVWSLDGHEAMNLTGAGGQVTAIGFDPRADRLAAGFAGGEVATWSLKDDRLLYRRLGHRGGTPVTSVAFSPDGSRIVTAGGDSRARVWEAATGRLLYTLRGHTGTVHGAAFSPNGDWLVTAATATVGLWDSTTQQRLLLLEPDGGRVLAASFDETGLRIVVAGSDGALTSFSCQIFCGGVTDLLALAGRRMAATGRELTPTERRHYLGGS